MIAINLNITIVKIYSLAFNECCTNHICRKSSNNIQLCNGITHTAKRNNKNPHLHLPKKGISKRDFTLTTSLWFWLLKINRNGEIGEKFVLYSMHVFQYLLSLLLMMSFGRVRGMFTWCGQKYVCVSIVFTIREECHIHTKLGRRTYRSSS